MEFASYVGWAGSILILLAYGGIAIGLIKNESGLSFFLNLMGAALLVIYGFILETWPPLFVNAFWIILTILSRIRTSPKKQKDNRDPFLGPEI